eukprot:TRINITY_DN1808_c0_g1_i2.p1 TRINITY_DN1808_c0_g1~~TRINITY_DN1808_c0_g1_i2.p1  ORF type:complete len:242 (+),score=48.03 TRINITY_DN1808_c0_g1_i2:108-728(+)
MASTVDTKKRLSDFRVLSFDCYGTLIHWEKGMLEALSKLGWGDVDPKTILSHFADLETAYQQANPTMLYPQILAGVVKQIAERLGRTLTDEQCVAFGKSIGEWPPFPDTPDALRYLSQHYKLVALSNIDRSSFAMSEALLNSTQLNSTQLNSPHLISSHPSSHLMSKNIITDGSQVRPCSDRTRHRFLQARSQQLQLPPQQSQRGL